MTAVDSPTEEEVKKLTSGFEKKYHKVLSQLDSLYKGTFDEDEAPSMAALCLITQGSLLSALASAELSARAKKRDIDFRKAEVFAELKMSPSDGKKLTDALVAQLVNKDEQVKELTRDYNEAEKEAKNLANIHALLKEAHITFRSIKKGI
jgi:hypothetical protein